MIEYLTCQSCFCGWSRTVKRGRKPSLCPRCRLASAPTARTRRVTPKTVILTDGGMSAAGFSERNDCTVRALANATGRSYAEAHEFMLRNGRKKGAGAQFRDIIFRNENQALGFNLIMTRGSNFVRMRGIRASMEKNPQLRTGTWILKMRAHVAVLKDGKLMDSFDSSRKDILWAWQVTPAE